MRLPSSRRDRYGETFAPTLLKDSLRILIMTTAGNFYLPHQMDKKSGFLHGIIDDEVFSELAPFQYDIKTCSKVVAKFN
jgi:hypothetical protein